MQKVVSPPRVTFSRFLSLVRRLRSRVTERTVYGVYERILERYRESHRFYHTLDHINECIATLDDVRRACIDPDVVEMTLWFHDIYYDTHGIDNESMSAVIAARECGVLHLTNAQENSVVRGVLATEHPRNRFRALSPDEKLIADIDLYGLSRSWDSVLKRSRAVRREFAYVDDASFAHGNLSFLASFTSDRKVYLSETFAEYEYAARENIIRIRSEMNRSIVTARPDDKDDI